VLTFDLFLRPRDIGSHTEVKVEGGGTKECLFACQDQERRRRKTIWKIHSLIHLLHLGYNHSGL
jgi:hypothetical protein